MTTATGMERKYIGNFFGKEKNKNLIFFWQRVGICTLDVLVTAGGIKFLFLLVFFSSSGEMFFLIFV